MKEIKLKGLEQSVYTETLNNGLEIFLVPYENKKNYFLVRGNHLFSLKKAL